MEMKSFHVRHWPPFKYYFSLVVVTQFKNDAPKSWIDSIAIRDKAESNIYLIYT